MDNRSQERRRDRLWHLFLRALRVVFFFVLPPLVCADVLVVAAREHAFAVDFHHAFWPAGRAVLEHRSPFPDATVQALGRGTAFVYPPVAAFAMAPFALLPRELADVLFTVVLAAAAGAALAICGVRDARVYGIAFLWPPVVFGLQAANITLLLTLGLALAWRYRDHRVRAACAVGAMLALKLFTWPLLVWLLVTRRSRTALGAALVAAAATAVAWALLGFAGASSYLDTMQLLSKLEAPASYTPFAFGLKLGLPAALSRLLALAAGAAAFGAALAAARRRRDAEAFGATVLASLVLSPIVWLHYFALLLVPLAIRRPSYTPLWLLPLALWGFPVGPKGPSLLAGVAVAVAALLVTVRRQAAEASAQAFRAPLAARR